MVFWIAVAVLVAAVTLAVTRPLMRDAAELADAAGPDLAVYRDQLTEIEADLARGTLSEIEAEAARTEVARRLIRRADASEIANINPEPYAARVIKPVLAAAVLALPLGSVLLYLAFGQPGLPGQPLGARIAAPLDKSNSSDLLAKVEARLRDYPDDGKGWDVIAPVYATLGRPADAASAYATAIRLLGESPARLLGFAEARIGAEGGIVPDDARKALQTVLVTEPKRTEPRIWLALAKEQNGDMAGAAVDYRALIAEAPEGARWRQGLADRLAKLDGAASTAPIAPPEALASPDAAKIAAMNPQDRAAVITKMVDGLAARLKTDGKDVVGWTKLIRAYQLMGRKEDALKAYADAKTQLAGDDSALKQIDELAKRLGLNS